MKTITFDYNDFNRTTSRDADTRRHGTAEIRNAAGGGVYIFGDLGCGKTRDNPRDALLAYLGGPELLSHRIYD